MSDIERSDVGEDAERAQRIRSFIQTSGRVVGGTAGAAVGLVGGPGFALAGGAVGQALGDLLAGAGVEFFERVLGHRQAERAAGALAVATVEINRRLNAGEAPRQDFVDGADDEASDAAEILEGTLLAAANAYEQRKVPFMGTFYANLAFDPDVTPTYANLLLKLLERLTYGQLRILATLGDDDCLNELVQVGARRNEGEFRSEADVIAEMDDLSNLGLVGVGQTDGQVFPPAGVLGGASWATMDLFAARLTRTGELVHRLLGLVEMATEERDAVVVALRGGLDA